MSFFKKAFYTLTTLAFLQGANCLLDPGSKSNVAVYWGQGQSDTSLAQFCESRKYLTWHVHIYIPTFADMIPDPGVDV